MRLATIGSGGSPAPVGEVVEALEAILDRAKRGEIVQVAIAYETSDGCTGDTFGCERRQHPVKLLGAIALMSHRIANWVREIG